MELRPLLPGEAPAAARAWLRARAAAYPAVPRGVHPDDEAAAWFVDVLVPSREVHVAVESDQVVGVLVLGERDLEQLYVVPERTGRGTGGALLSLAQQRRPGGLSLWTFQSNVRARAFYGRHGFAEVEATDGRDNEERAPDVRMAWPGAPTPYEVVAVNLDPQADNRIHDDDVAQRFGFAGALVPGVEVFALASAPLVASYGEAFLSGGRVALRFRRPVYDGEPVVVTAQDGALAVTGPDGVVRASGSFATGPQEPPTHYEDAPLPEALRPAPQLGPLGTVRVPADPAACADYVRRIGEPSPLYAELVHPGLLLRLVNLALMSGVALGPWIHTASDCRLMSAARVDEPLEVRSRVTELLERNGHDYVRYDALVLATGRPVAEVHHEAIWRLAGT